jgi:hypothetical protein
MDSGRRNNTTFRGSAKYRGYGSWVKMGDAGELSQKKYEYRNPREAPAQDKSETNPKLTVS